MAWGVTIAALVFNFLCSYYFNAVRTNIVYDAIYFVMGGLLFLYRKELAEFARKYQVIACAILLASTISYFVLGFSTFTILFFCVAVMIHTLGCMGEKLANPVANFLGGISFEMYLCHMVIYRMLEKLHLIHLFIWRWSTVIYFHSSRSDLWLNCVFSMRKVIFNKIEAFEAFIKKRVNNRSVRHV